ncbi:UNVERIFIED_CONTAM: hypothetical protein Slati_2932300 [Sesamum latifolium]|uniref:Retrotransposon protein, putative, Ty1-copia subclass n=1 Tax=Sesamum latifolium TaxID=2727402 RepID=A0AAW2VH25_9LAMI
MIGLRMFPSIMLRMKDVYAVPDRHIRYAAIKAFFGPRWPKDRLYKVMGSRCFPLWKSSRTLKLGLTMTRNDPQVRAGVLVGEASTSKAKGKGARRWKRKKGKGTAVTATASTEGAPPAARRERAKGRLGVLSGRRQMMCACIAMERGIGRGSVHNSSPNPGKDDQEALCWTNAIANDLLDLVHTDVCGPLSIPARGGFSYFITFTDDHSRYGYIYLMRYKSEAFGRFKEYRLEVENKLTANKSPSVGPRR